jgi:predicted nucleic acid-binding protein
MLELRYWDSCCCLTWLNEDEDFELCKGTLDEASRGNIQIRTSTFTPIEVLYLKTKGEIDKEKSKRVIEEFFNRSFIIPIVVDVPIADLAREVFLDYGIDHKDAIHIASAIYDGISIFNTFDRDLLKKDGKIGNPALRIIKPDIIYKDRLFETEEK